MDDLLTIIGRDVEHLILEYLTIEEYIRFTSTNKNKLKLRTESFHYQNVGVDTCKLLNAIFDKKQNVLIHGPGGCGKTYALTSVWRVATKNKLRIIMTGTTGVSASVLPNGRTIHSFSGLKKGTIPLDILEKKVENKPHLFKQFNDIDILVIDEISMLGTRMFQKLDCIARRVRENNRPFGGIQLIFCGDFLQLPPVADKFIFTLPEWESLDLQVIPFSTSFRQHEDLHFFKLLNRVRTGTVTIEDMNLLKQKVVKKVPDFIYRDVGKILVPPLMYSTHVQVNNYNNDRLNSFEGDNFQVSAEDNFMRLVRDENGVSFINSDAVNIPLTIGQRIEHYQPNIITLKTKGQYIITQNIPSEKIVNGTIAMLIEDDEKLQLVQPNGTKTPITKLYMTRCHHIVNDIYLMRKQLVLRVGYAVTIHSSQGMTLDNAVIDAGPSIFASAQLYVALSRVRKFENLHLLDFNEKSIKVHKKACDYVLKFENIN